MSGLSVHAVVRRAGFVLDARFAAQPGEVLALLGPNGAGKTTALRAIAGLVRLDAGAIRLDGRTLDDPDAAVYLAPQHRGLGVVFQDHRLFPHLHVLDNVAFGLRSTGVDRRTARADATAWVERMGLADLAGRRPRALSGGQAQRVALARALAADPAALLLDEPLAALDVQTRAEIQGELRDHLAGYRGPTVLVTHDPIEALLLAGRIVVIEGGRVVQEGSPAEVTRRPVTEYVARLVGMNLFSGRADGHRVAVDGGGELVIAEPAAGAVLVALRPSAITVHDSVPVPSSARNVWPGRIAALAPLGDRIRLTVEAAGRPAPTVAVDVTAAAVAELDLRPGRAVWLSAKASEVDAYPAAD